MVRAVAIALTLILAAGCAETQYVPRRVARGELTLRYHEAYEMWGGDRMVARGLTYDGLEDYVACVPEARGHAHAARSAGRAAVGLSIGGAVLGVGSVGGLVTALNDDGRKHAWLGASLGVATLGVVLSALGRRQRNRANGHAVDALNYYNDAVGSLGATCDDLTYPPPVSDATPAP